MFGIVCIKYASFNCIYCTVITLFLFSINNKQLSITVINNVETVKKDIDGQTCFVTYVQSTTSVCGCVVAMLFVFVFVFVCVCLFFFVCIYVYWYDKLEIPNKRLKYKTEKTSK